MSNTHFSASVRPQDGVAVIDLHGEINGTSEEALNRAYAQAISQQPSAVLLNFAQVDYINSTGIALIVGLLAQARKAKHRLMTYGLSSHYQEIFRITRLSDFMGMFDDEASALKSVKRET
ncbi:MAG: STAS domain-containing protein, partial [Chloroflexota bacterium]